MHISEALQLIGYPGYPKDRRFKKRHIAEPDYELYNTFYKRLVFCLIPFIEGHKNLDQVKQDAVLLFEAHYTIHGLKNPKKKAEYSIAALKTRRGQLILSSLIDYAVFEFDRIPEPKGFPKSLYDVWFLPHFYEHTFDTIYILEKNLIREGQNVIQRRADNAHEAIWHRDDLNTHFELA